MQSNMLAKKKKKGLRAVSYWYPMWLPPAPITHSQNIHQSLQKQSASQESQVLLRHIHPLRKQNDNFHTNKCNLKKQTKGIFQISCLNILPWFKCSLSSQMSFIMKPAIIHRSPLCLRAAPIYVPVDHMGYQALFFSIYSVAHIGSD